jgi:hypothetical protein
MIKRSHCRAAPSRWAKKELASSRFSCSELLVLVSHLQRRSCALQSLTPKPGRCTRAANFFVPRRDGNLVPNGRRIPRLVAERERLARTSWSRAPSGERGTPFSGWSKTKSGLDAASSVSGWWLHDLRRTLATGLQRLGVRLEVTEAVLNHLSGSRAGVVGIYQRHDWAKEKRSALDAWSAHLLAVAEGRLTTGERSAWQCDELPRSPRSSPHGYASTLGGPSNTVTAESIGTRLCQSVSCW